MVRKLLKWTGIGLGALLGLVVIAVLVVGLLGGRKFSRSYTVETPFLTIPTDAPSIAEGERLVAIRACSDCHGDDFAGELLVDDAGFGRLYALNLTGGRNSVTADFTPADWDRAIRHGVAARVDR